MPLRPASRFVGMRIAGRIAAADALIAVLSVFAQGSKPPRPSDRTGLDPVAAAFVPAAAIATRAVVPLAPSGPLYRLDDTDALDPPRSEPARFNPATASREDTLIQGGFETIDAPYLQVTITESRVSEPVPSLFVNLVRRAADGPGLAVERTGERGRIDTKFGPVETLEATLAGPGHRVCAGFATIGRSPIRLDGWLCASLGQPPEPRAIVCALDKVVPDGRDDPHVDAAFQNLAKRRDAACRPLPFAADKTAETGSIGRRSRKIEAGLRQTPQARP